MIHVVDHLLRVTGASRLVLTGGVALNAIGNMRLLEHFDEAWFAERTAAQGAAASVGAAGARRSRRHHRRGLAVRASGGRAARRADDACVLLRLAADRNDDIATALQADDIASQRIGDISSAGWPRRHRRPDGVHGGAERHDRAVSGRGRDRAARARPSLDLRQSLRRASARAAQRTRQIPRGDPPAGADGDAGSRAQQYFDLLPGASDAGYNAYNYMVLTAQSKPARARKNPGRDPCRRHRPDPDRQCR